jgi:DNA polymerase III epsilon subunit-like protein
MNVMIDIETLGVQPGCAILSIAAVKFDHAKVIDTQYNRISVESNHDAGLSCYLPTVEWWINQPAESQAELKNKDRVSIDALDDFLAVDEEIQMWANSPSFDLEILRFAYAKINKDPPYKYYNERCYRTLKSLRLDIDFTPPRIKHHALHDAIAQAEHAIKILNTITL